MSVLRVRNLCLRLGTDQILAHLDCRVGKGELLVIIGPNGAGKTSLIRCVAGLLSPASGEIYLMGCPLAAYSRRQLAVHIALVPQQVGLEFPFTSLETVLMGRSPHLGLLAAEQESDFRLARHAMEYTGVTHLADRRLDTLSGGELQRVVIARAICQQPRLMLLDEPTAALDPAHQLAIMQLMRSLIREQEMSVVMVSHDLNLAAMFASRILLLRGGQKIGEGTPAEILTPDSLQHAYGCTMYVDIHPVSGTPRITLVDKKSEQQSFGKTEYPLRSSSCHM